jgi:leader peptidase (prepilin peptidase) / N-methyltransferase
LISETFRLFFSSWFVYLIFGMIFGSFLNVVIYRVPEGKSIVSPPSSCPKCGHVIKWYENIPVFSWLFLRAKCSGCQLPISVEYPIVEALTGLITLGLFLYAGPSAVLLIYIPLSYVLFCIMVIDYKTYSIPHGLNITLLAVSVFGSIINFSAGNFLNLSYYAPFLGALTGAGLMFLIQFAGKMIYKQDAMGTGDVYLMGAAGILLGPKLIFTAFIFGSVIAVVSYSVPSFISFIKRKNEALKFRSTADQLFRSFNDPDTELDLAGLKMQLSLAFGENGSGEIADQIKSGFRKLDLKNITLLKLYFRFKAVDDNDTSVEILKKFKPDDKNAALDIKFVINEDLIGYDSFEDNFKLLYDDCRKNGLDGLLKVLDENKKLILEQKTSFDIDKIASEASEIKDPAARLEVLLKYNRQFQFNGFTAEQKKITAIIESDPELNDRKFQERFYSDLSYVYYKDFYFKDSSESFEKLIKMADKDSVSPETIKSIYNISLFRLVFYKQRLAFGPFLALGIMLSLLWGNIIILAYFNFLQRFFFNV